MKNRIGILHLEDSLKDSELIRSVIDLGGINYNYFLADNEIDYIAFLKTGNIDIILSDFSLPDYNGIEALKVAKGKYSNTPFIFLSGAMGEDAAINAMLNGATDYVLKGKLERLVPAIKRALHERELAINEKNAVAALRESEKKYKSLVSEVNDGYFVTNKKGVITFANSSMAKIFGLKSPGDLIGNNILDFYNTSKLNDGKRIFKEIIKKKEKVYGLEMEVLGANGKLIYTELDAVPVMENNIITGMQGVIHDITERKQAEINLNEKNLQIEAQNLKYIQINSELTISKEKAEESDKLKTAFLQNMSHEIRTPLNGIIGFSELLNEEDITREEIKKYTDIICLSGNRLIEIVNNVLDISKIQTGQIYIEKKSINVSTLFSDLLTFFSVSANKKNISLTYNYPEKEFETIYTDEAKLYQILTNLINNAIKYSKSDTIDLGYEIKGNEVQFSVKDKGIGIPIELHSKIFERFIQGKLALSAGIEGAGLGLAICKGLVGLLGGEIWLVSEVNKGTTFYFTLPIEPVNPPPQTYPEQKTTKSDLHYQLLPETYA